MSSTLGNVIKTTIFGESHGNAIGAVVDAFPAGYKIDLDQVNIQMKRRAPGSDQTATKRKELDEPEILSGLLNDITTGAPLSLIIRNNDCHSTDYSRFSDCPRPSHADYTANVRYNGFNDIRGGGNFSGRLTAPLTAAGTIAKQILKANGVTIGGHVSFIGNTADTPFDPCLVDEKLLDSLNTQYFATVSSEAKASMNDEIAQAKADGDSIGGEVEIAVVGLPVGIGSPTVRGVENAVSSAVFAVPAVKGIEFGAGFGFASMRGSEANDQMYYDGDTVKCKTNNSGGILGGITNGMPLILRVALKPTPSINLPQDTINLKLKQNDTISIKGRHDPCIVPRALPAIEAAVALALIDLIEEVRPLSKPNDQK